MPTPKRPIDAETALRKLDAYRAKLDAGTLTPGAGGHAVRVACAIVAELAGYRDRHDWRHLQAETNPAT